MPRDFQSQPLILGLEGLDLQTVLDKVSPNAAVRLTNMLRHEKGGITVRPGLTQVAQNVGYPIIRTLVRLNDSDANVEALGFTDDGLTPRGYRFVSGAGKLGMLNGSTITTIDTAWGNEPLSTLAYRPTLSATPWLFLADAQKMRKVRPQSTTTALVLPLGLPQPLNPDASFEHDELPLLIKYRGGSAFALDERDLARLAAGIEFDIVPGASSYLYEADTARITVIDRCDSVTDWSANNGTAATAKIAADTTNKKEGAASLKFSVTTPGTAYYAFFNKEITVDLSKAGPYDASDYDQIHFWARLDNPQYVEEIRLYFILSNYSSSVIPGTSTTANDNAYVLVFRPSDYQAFLELSEGQLTGQATYNVNQQTQQQAGGGQGNVPEMAPGRGAWTEFGAVGLPVLRGNPEDVINRSFAGFRRVGEDDTLDWSDVVGLCVVLKTSASQDINLWLDDLYLVGGAGPDSSFPGNAKYNYRYTHFDPRTGAESNPCNVSPSELWVESVRQAIRVKPTAYGDSAIRQRFYRQGGALVQNWYYVGQNDVDGGEYIDDKSDNALLNAALVQTDHDQPVTTVDSQGVTVLAQPLHTIFGPLNDVIFGLGDPYRKGNIYWCKTGEPDHWPAINTRELCGSSEELVAGCLWRTQAFAFSPVQGYALLPNIVQAGTVDYVPLGMTRGPVNRHCLAVTSDGVAFVAKDGVFMTQGGPEISLTDDRLYRLFHGETVEECPPIDPTAVAEGDVRLVWANNELRLLYRGDDNYALSPNDVDPTSQGMYELVLSFSDEPRYWRFNSYAPSRQISAVYAEPTVARSLLMGARFTGTVYENSGATDDGLAIPWAYRSGALDQGDSRRLKEYGDVWVEADRKGNTIGVAMLAENETIQLDKLSIDTGSGKRGYVLDVFSNNVSSYQGDEGSYSATNVSLHLYGTSSSATPPILYQAQISYLINPDASVKRVLSEQDEQGRLTDKYVKGIMIECDTQGVDKAIAIQGDGTTQATITVNAAGRRSLLFSWAEFRARLIRVLPTDDTEWIVWGYRWIFDEEPAQLTRWESQPLNYGIPGFHVIPYTWVTIACVADVTLTLTYYGQNGVTTTVVTKTISSTGGEKRTIFVGLDPGKGVLSKWLFTSSEAFWLYRPETSVMVQPWMGGGGAEVKPFGDDDLDKVRGLGDAGLAASRGGGGGE